MEDKMAKRVARALHPLKVDVVAYIHRGILVNVYVFYDRRDAFKKELELLDDPDYNKNDDDVAIFYDVLIVLEDRRREKRRKDN